MQGWRNTMEDSHITQVLDETPGKIAFLFPDTFHSPEITICIRFGLARINMQEVKNFVPPIFFLEGSQAS